MSGHQKVDRSSPVPFHHQLKSILLARIREGAHPPGSKLPSESELCTRYEVSRTVVRQTLGALEVEGFVLRRKGFGTFVIDRPAAQGLVRSLSGLFEDVASRGKTLESRVLSLSTVPAPSEVAIDLGLVAGDPVVVLERLRAVGAEVLAYTTTWMPAALVPGITAIDFSHVSLYAVLEHNYGITLARGQRSVEAAAASAELAEYLEIIVGDPVLVLRSVSYDAAGVAVEAFRAFHRSDRSRFDVDVVRGK